MVESAYKDAIRFFFAQGRRLAIFRWLEFRLYLQDPNTKSFPNTHDNAAQTLIQQLSAWEQKSLTYQPVFFGFSIILLCMALLGAGSMASALNYTQTHPINIWIPLVVFSFGPLLMTLLSVFFSLRTSRNQSLNHHLWLRLFIKRFRLDRYAPFQSLMLRWLVWQIQSLSLAFLIGALVAFFALATFQDYTFGWSSTLIKDDATMAHIIAVITWPWHWWITVPDTNTVQLSRFMMNALPNAIDDDGWWQTLVFSTLVYGILPRVLLMVWLQVRYTAALKRNILQAGDIEQFLAIQMHRASQNAITDELPSEQVEKLPMSTLKGSLIGWHFQQASLPFVKHLGMSSWQEDEAWLRSADAQSLSSKTLVTDGMATPTGELADSVALLKGNLSLAIVFTEQNDVRQATQIKSWQYFAQKHQLNLKVVQ